MKIYDKSVPKQLRAELDERLAIADALIHSGAQAFDFVDATRRKLPSATQAFLSAIVNRIPIAHGQKERALLVRFGLSAPGLGEGFTCCYDALLEDDALVSCQMGLDYGGRHLTIYVQAATRARLNQLLTAVAQCGSDYDLALQKTTDDRLDRIPDSLSFGIPFMFRGG